MTQFRDEPSLSRIELVVLARLSQGKATPTDNELGEVVHDLALPNESAEAARRRAVELLTGLVRRKLVTSDGQAVAPASKSAPKPRKLTDDGKRVLRNVFNLPKVPTWAQVRDKHLPALGIGKASSSTPKQRTASGEMVAALLRTRFGIPDAPTAMDVCDALIADALKMPRGKLTLEALRAHVLLRSVDNQANAPRPQVKMTKSGKPAKSSYADQLATWVAYTTIGVNNGKDDKATIARALARRWVCGDANSPGEPATNALPPRSTAKPTDAGGTGVLPFPPQNPVGPAQHNVRNPPELPVSQVKPLSSTADLLEVVRDTIPRVGIDGRHGEKVYVSAIWRTLERDRRVSDLSLDHFKTWLLNANRDGRLVLARADLVGAMDAKQVRESEINDRGTTFHFVLDQRNGVTVSQRGSYAR